MDIFNIPYLYAKRYVAKTLLSNDILVFPRYDADRDDNYQNYIISIPDLVTSLAALLPAAATPVVSGLSPLFTTVVTPGIAPTITFTAINQNANLFYAGPASGVAAAPTFRGLVPADLDTLNLPIGNAGLVSGQHYVDTAANILANGDLVVGRKV